MDDDSIPATIIEGRCAHKTSNALQISFHDGPDEPFAVGVQGAGDGRGKKLGILFGFKNGGTGNHIVTYRDGSQLGVSSRDLAPTVLTRDGAEIATVARGANSTATGPDGAAILSFLPDPVEPVTPDLFRLVVAAPAGEHIGRLDIVRRLDGWTMSRAIEAAWAEYVWWDHAGRALPLPFLGTRVVVDRAVTTIERDVLVAAYLDIAIGLRPYMDEMASPRHA